MITSHRPHQHPHINPMPLIALGVVIIVMFSVITLMPPKPLDNIKEPEPAKIEKRYMPLQGNAFPLYRQSERTLVEIQYAGEYSHIGDCGFDRYHHPESGAAGYCYVIPPERPAANAQPSQPPVPAKKRVNDKYTQTQSLEQPDVSIPGSTPVIDDQPSSGNSTPSDVPSVVPPVNPPDTSTEAPKHCNKGGGNGGEGCDPGNHPENGNDDEP